MARQQERRLSPRKPTERLTYIQLPSGNGGIITDISEDGIGFSAAGPLSAETSAPIEFSFSGRYRRIPAVGDLVWVNDTKRSGGLRFRELPGEIRRQIRRQPFESRVQIGAHERRNFRAILRPAAQYLLRRGGLLESSARARRYYHRRFGSRAGNENRSGRRTSIIALVIGIAGLAGVLGFISGAWYHGTRELSNSKNLLEVQVPRAPKMPRDWNVSSELALFSDVQSDRVQRDDTSLADSAGPASADARGLLRIDRQGPAKTQAAAKHPQRDAGNDPLFVQIGVFPRESEAGELVEVLRRRNFVAFASQAPNDTLYHVQLGPFITEEAAEMTESALEQVGFDPVILHLHR